MRSIPYIICINFTFRHFSVNVVSLCIPSYLHDLTDTKTFNLKMAQVCFLACSFVTSNGEPGRCLERRPTDPILCFIVLTDSVFFSFSYS